ncbi:MAG: type ISP restriction/modification enzyme [Chloroflexota bacterium]
MNDRLTLKGIPAEAFEYRLGNRSALDWVIGQYQLKTDLWRKIESASATSTPAMYRSKAAYSVLQSLAVKGETFV